MTTPPSQTHKEIVHQCPKGDSGVMPCCGRTPFEAVNDRITTDKKKVTCGKGRKKRKHRHRYSERMRMEKFDEVIPDTQNRFKWRSIGYHIKVVMACKCGKVRP